MKLNQTVLMSGHPRLSWYSCLSHKEVSFQIIYNNKIIDKTKTLVQSISLIGRRLNCLTLRG